MRILGIDPGLRLTGFGVIDVQGSRLQYVSSGTIKVPTELGLEQRLRVILENIGEVIQATAPQVAAIEKVFVNANPHSTLLLGQARGAALCALALADLPVHEYTALQIKKTVTGQGHAAKEQIQLMVKHLLQLNGTPAPDAADALACAISHAQFAPVLRQLEQHAELTGARRIRGGRLIR
ncbi:crossover junction endodeoxyribonuclease RuvC [Alcaligenes endophyticus]|uniref:Crossover junction endodeoxyribonuclease RuvC n=1 Tax=Alcaligenes endophyticus TaxID=1929088 RepID=A0ABT8EHC9_9BURK|nr:crossover junction endodeoxyribonuclease RuvC [Alcaligenes endophyticus]MCX5589734.1 crossover junction endodeoxyribonuclease RuvC [Alcaligenes endophyticus]MDN4120602.1 crossover junction endodeoxyribonuclease RuvC [Alcaligenes endophyticus]